MFRFGVALSAILMVGCSYSPDGPRFIVVDSFGTTILRTDDKDEAYRISDRLTLLGRPFPGKPQYFVLDSRNGEKE